MVDVTGLAGRIQGMLVRPDATLLEHGRPVPPWPVVAREHAAPLIIASASVSFVLYWIFGMPAVGVVEAPSLTEAVLGFVLRVVVNFAGLALMALVVRVFSAMFGGSPDFNASYVLVALAMTPYYVGEAVLPLPVVGGLLAFGGMIFSLIILYKGVPPLLRVPQENRSKHFALTLVSLFLATMVAALILGPFLLMAPT
ncbi:MAG: Yip1 family protein [Inquilinaceae bacterium]